MAALGRGGLCHCGQFGGDDEGVHVTKPARCRRSAAIDSVASPAGEIVFKRAGDDVEIARPFAEISTDVLVKALPWRTFRWYYGQWHYSGFYWSATQQAHVIYESRLELARLMFADFDRSVNHIAAQPFLLRSEVDGQLRRHVPDYLLLTEQGPIVVDVKPASCLTVPKVGFTFEWTRRLVESRGWRYQVWSEPDEVELANIRFLAGYRRDWLFDVNSFSLPRHDRHRSSGWSAIRWSGW
ncbi:TnsA-like heteromeric transposase endonuclease subunit [Nocardia sp. NPDC059764]|uniref:TnsA-like heteromeric transposase endonuclease subunit n=1 Tax=Nocardia sp. NPDC059764 TaxID=3346939 RepID=UPI003669E5F2